MLTARDIYKEEETKELLNDDLSPNVKDVVFDVQQFLNRILGNITDKMLTNEGKKYSLTDVRNFRLHSEQDIRNLFSECFNIDVDSNKGIHEINIIFDKCIDIFQSRYCKYLSGDITSTQINNIQDIKRIFESTGKGKRGITYCALSKLFRSYATLTQDTRIQYIDSIHNDILDNLSSTLFDTIDINKKLISGNMRLGGKSLPVKLLHRSKTHDSIIGKAIGNINYDTIDDYADLHGFTFEVDSEKEEDIIRVMHQVFGTIQEKAVQDPQMGYKIKIENKGMVHMHKQDNGVYTIPTLEEMYTQGRISNEFYDACRNGFIESYEDLQEKKGVKQSASGYQDVKFEVMYETNDPTESNNKLYSGTEIKVVKKSNTNETGLAFQPIYGYAKLFRELSRLVGYIRHTDIIHFVNDFFETLDDNLNKKGITNKYGFLEELLYDLQKEGFIENSFQYDKDNIFIQKQLERGLYKYFESGLVRVKASKNAKTFFYIHPSYYELVPEVQPELYEI